MKDINRHEDIYEGAVYNCLKDHQDLVDSEVSAESLNNDVENSRKAIEEKRVLKVIKKMNHLLVDWKRSKHIHSTICMKLPKGYSKRQKRYAQEYLELLGYKVERYDNENGKTILRITAKKLHP